MATQALSFDFDGGEEDDGGADNGKWGRLVVLTNGGLSDLENTDLFCSQPTYVLGRSARDCQIRLRSQLVSGKHLRLERRPAPSSADDGELLPFIVDVSSNGTWLNGQRLAKNEPRMLTSGDEIVLVRASNQGPSLSLLFQEGDAAAGHANSKKRSHEMLAGGNEGGGEPLQDDEQSNSPAANGSGIHMPPPRKVARKGEKGNAGAVASSAAAAGVVRPEDKYEILHTLGSGNFAVVKMCVQSATGKQFAMKIVDKKQYAKQAVNYRPDAMMDEVRILQKISHPHVVGIEEVFDMDDALYIVLQLVTGGELFDFIVEHGSVEEDSARTLFKQLLDSVHYLHERNIVHRDLKPENILFADKTYSTLLLSDFGLSKSVNQGSFMKTMCGTPQYLAPEVMQPALITEFAKRDSFDHGASAGTNGMSSGSASAGYSSGSTSSTDVGSSSMLGAQNGGTAGYSANVDCWSLGAILYVLLSGAAPFDDTKPMPLFRGDEEDDFLCPVEFCRPSEDFWGTIAPAAKDLIRRLMCVNPHRRYSSSQALQHPWITGESMDRLDAETAEREASRRRAKEEREAAAKAAEEAKIAARVQAEVVKAEAAMLKKDPAKRARANLERDFYLKDKAKPKKRQRVACRHGAACYRKNPQHFADEAHPDLWPLLEDSDE